MKLKFNVCMGFYLSFIVCTLQAAHVGDTFAQWLKDPVFKAKYAKLVENSPIVSQNSWLFKDAKLQVSQSFKGQNDNTWVHTSTCSTEKSACRFNHIDIFYDVNNQQIFAYLTLGNRVGWMGKPTPLEKAFFTPYLTAKTILQQ